MDEGWKEERTMKGLLVIEAQEEKPTLAR